VIHWAPAGAILLASVVASTAVAEVSPHDFAYGMPILTPAAAPAYRLAVPLEVYRKVVYEDLRDVRVFNARGEVVPYELEPRPRAGTRQPELSLPLFALRGDSRPVLDGVRITVQSQGTAVNVQAPAAVIEPHAIASYVLDARGAALPLRALQLHWQEDAPEFSGEMRIESSDDLGSWRTVKASAAVVNLRTGAARLLQSHLEIPPTKAKFWRLSWIGGTAPFELDGVTADAISDPTAVEHSSLAAVGSALNGQRREFSFDLGARLPVQRVNIELPEPNSVATIQLLSRARPTDAWRPIAHGQIYRVGNAAAERRSEPIAIATNRDRYWLARFDQPPSAGNVSPGLKVSWDTEELVFLARGGGPFLLAYGDGSADAETVTLGPLIAGVAVLSAQTGRPQPLGGAERLQTGPRVFAWKRVVLWSVLALGIALLAWMAYQLSRQLGNRPTPPAQ
jgi:hypothetical protein